MQYVRVKPVALFPTCVVDAVAPQVGFATARVLTRRGCDVDVAERTTCCGQPAWNAGQTEAAATVARTTLRGFEEALEDGAEAIVVPAGSCTTMIRRFWTELFEIERDPDAVRRAESVIPKVFELSEFLRTCDAQSPRPLLSITSSGRGSGSGSGSVRYHPSCHMLRELGLRDEPCA